MNKIAYVTRYDPSNINNWSCLGYFIAKSLKESGNRIEYISNLSTEKNFFDICQRLYSGVLGKNFHFERLTSTAKNYSRQAAKRLLNVDHDVIFSPSTIPISYLNTGAPKIVYTDATFACMLGYYKAFCNLSSKTIREGHQLEQRALDTCSLAIYSSAWAAASAVNDYGLSATKVRVVPFGANFNKHFSKNEVRQFIANKEPGVLNLLFNGVDWDRKGGELVLAVVDELQSRGCKVNLHIVGLRHLPKEKLPKNVFNYGFLDKSRERDMAKLDELYRTCHFLLLPSRAETFGCVFCEANLYGMPCITTDTGGITSAITQGKNGFALNAGSDSRDYADIILYYFSNKDRYLALSLSSYDEYCNRLNWRATGQSLSKLIEATIDSQKPAPCLNAY